MDCLDGHELVVPLFSTDVAEGTVVSGVFSDVGDFMHRMVML